MAQPQNFRSAFNGFNREDVVHYLEYLNTKHQNQIQQMNQEMEQLRQQLEDPTEALEALARQVQELTEQLAQAQQRCQELEDQAAQPPAEEPVLPAQEAHQLDTYRRAEQVETMARQRSELVYHQAKGVLHQATTRVDRASEQLTEVADQVLGQIAQLQMAVSSSKQALQDASSLMKAIRPNQ